MGTMVKRKGMGRDRDCFARMGWGLQSNIRKGVGRDGIALRGWDGDYSQT